MKTKARRRTTVKNEGKIEVQAHIAREVGALIYAVLAVLLYLALSGRGGILGTAVNTGLRTVFGLGALALPVILLLFSGTLFFSRRILLHATRYLGVGLIGLAVLGLIHTQTPPNAMLDNVEHYGGYAGFLTSVLLRIFISDLGARIVLFAAFLAGLLITFEISLREILHWILGQKPLQRSSTSTPARPRLKALPGPSKEISPLPEKPESEINIVKPQLKRTEEELAIKKPGSGPASKPSSTLITADETDYSDWQFPPLSLLSSDTSEVYVSDQVLKENAEKIREKLSQFGIEVTMKDVNIGPTVLQYTLQPQEGVKLTKITALKNDLALALAAKSIRMEAPIPGKSLVGIEVPNEKRMIVHLREMLESAEFDSLKSKLRLVIGRDVSGVPVIDDLAAMPHLLVAGATGSGKSVGMNTFLLSLLYQNSPRDLKFIMIDPKRVELTPYNGIPHLLTPVITDPEKAHTALKWAVAEMQRRYTEFAEKGYKNIREYNEAEARTLHTIVIVIDELADLMMQANKKETEALICRIAQMARAVGMHLIIATQRPSVDVITGVIKANIPTRIAFTVTSGVDSRTIIDTVGAEDLLGMGDMLFLPGNMSRAIRVQGVYVSTKEIERVTNRIKLTVEPAYDESIVSSSEGASALGMVGAGDGADQDDLYNEAVAVIRETGKASASLLQRRLSVGYARAARLLDLLEEHGLIGPVNGAKPRAIYIPGASEGG